MKLEKLRLTIIMLICGIVEVSILPYFLPLRIKPNLFLVLLIAAGMDLGLIWVFLLALACGFFRDIFAARLVGFNTIFFSIFASIIYFVGCRVFSEAYGVKYALICIFTILYYALLSFILGKPYILIGFPEAVLNCFIFKLFQMFVFRFNLLKVDD